MKARGADLGALWEGVCYRFERQGLHVPPRRWRIFHNVVGVVLTWGAAQSTRTSLIRRLIATLK